MNWRLGIASGWVLGLVGCGVEESPPPPPSSAEEMAYRTHCAACHQWDGSGVERMYPPLADVDWVQTEDPLTLIRIVLHGMVGPVHLNGEKFQTTAPIMPAQGAMLDDETVASILSFVLQEFGDRETEVTPANVADVRKADRKRETPWTEKELLNE